MPLSYTWSLTLNQKLPWSMNVELGYVGNKNEHLVNNGIANYNAVPLGAMLNDPNSGNQQLYRPLPAYGDLNVYRHNAYSNYHALQTLLEPAARATSTSRRAYTFSKALGIRTNETGQLLGLGVHRRPAGVLLRDQRSATARTWRASRSPGS